MKTFKKHIENMVAKNSERQLMQQTYLFITASLIIAAGLTSLMNQTAGQFILIFAGISLMVFIVNTVVWSLVRSYLESYFYSKKLASSKKPKNR